MHKKFITTGALLGAIAVALGAFGAHGLKKLFRQKQYKHFKQAFNIKCIMHLLYC